MTPTPDRSPRRRPGWPPSPRERSILVCCGSGGVGKTTAAAALAMAGAMAGRNAVVVTIDPAKRLADTLGLECAGQRTDPIPGRGRPAASCGR
jgi:Mrp family chromosome partitioning ATPase